MQELATEVSERIQRAFGDRASDMTIYDVVDVPNHHMLVLNLKPMIIMKLILAMN